MSALLTSSGREPKAGRLDGEMPSSRPARRTPITRDERLRLFGHLSHEEKRQLRKLVDAARRQREGIDRNSGLAIRERCTGTNYQGRPCLNWARSGSDLCAVHLRRMVA